MKFSNNIVKFFLSFAILIISLNVSNAGDNTIVYFGTYTSGDSDGIYVAIMDPETGRLSKTKLAVKVENPSFLAIHPNQKHLYSIGVMKDDAGKKKGAVNSYSIDYDNGELKLINQKSVIGNGPCHLVVDSSGKNVLAANYGSGSVVCIPINEDGSLREHSSFIQHTGSSVNPRRQKGPHAHSINVDLNNNYAVAADLGLDKIMIYKLDSQKGKLTPNNPASVSVPAGGGPRHFVFHPNNKLAYTNNEITCTVTGFNYNSEKGSLEEFQTISTLPEAVKDSYSTAEIRVHPNGRFLYVSNRGHDSIAMFTIDQETGKLTAIGHEPTQGKIPRNFNLDPSGNFLLAANMKSDNIVIFRIDQETGKLKATGHEIKVPSSCCIRFISLDD